jgi:cell wall-associated NlpC family hydrolase
VTSPPGSKYPEITAYKSNNTDESSGNIPDFTVLPCVKNIKVNDRVLVYLPDEQEVWIKEDEIRPYDASPSKRENVENISDSQIGIVNKPSISFYRNRESDEASGEFYVLTKLSLLKDCDYTEEQGRLPVISPKGEKVWINGDDVDLRSKAHPFPRQSMAKADELGQALLDRKTPFRWGGATPETGYDCSKYLRACMLMAGVELPLNSRDQFDLIKTDQANFRLVAQHTNPAHKNINFSIAPFTDYPSESPKCGDIVFFHFPIDDKGKIIRTEEKNPVTYRVMYNGFISKDGKFLHSEGTQYHKVTKSCLACFSDQASNEAELYTTSAHYFTIMRPLWYYNEDIKGTIPGTEPSSADIHHHFKEATEFFDRLFSETQDDEILRDISPRVKDRYMDLVAGAELSKKAIAENTAIEEATGVFRTCTENLMGIKLQLEKYIQNKE